MTNNTQMIRDALGSPIPQMLNVDGSYTVLANGETTGIDFSKHELLRDKLGSPIPYQFFDVEQMKFVDGVLGGSGGEGQAVWATIVGKPSRFPPTAHEHEIVEINGLGDELANIRQELDKPIAPQVHTHEIGDITGLSTQLTTMQQAIDDSKKMGQFEWRYNSVTNSLDLVVIE